MANEWSTGLWGVGSWGLNSDATVDVTGASLSSNLGDVTVDAQINSGWGRQEWGNGVWGDAYTVQLSGLSATFNLDSVSIQTDVGVDVEGIQLTSTLGNTTAFTDVGVDVTGGRRVLPQAEVARRERDRNVGSRCLGAPGGFPKHID
jgi:hypothetical protein